MKVESEFRRRKKVQSHLHFDISPSLLVLLYLYRSSHHHTEEEDGQRRRTITETSAQAREPTPICSRWPRLIWCWSFPAAQTSTSVSTGTKLFRRGRSGSFDSAEETHPWPVCQSTPETETRRRQRCRPIQAESRSDVHCAHMVSRAVRYSPSRGQAGHYHSSGLVGQRCGGSDLDQRSERGDLAQRSGVQGHQRLGCRGTTDGFGG